MDYFKQEIESQKQQNEKLEFKVHIYQEELENKEQILS